MRRPNKPIVRTKSVGNALDMVERRDRSRNVTRNNSPDLNTLREKALRSVQRARTFQAGKINKPVIPKETAEPGPVTLNAYKAPDFSPEPSPETPPIPRQRSIKNNSELLVAVVGNEVTDEIQVKAARVTKKKSFREKEFFQTSEFQSKPVVDSTGVKRTLSCRSTNSTRSRKKPSRRNSRKDPDESDFFSPKKTIETEFFSETEILSPKKNSSSDYDTTSLSSVSSTSSDNSEKRNVPPALKCLLSKSEPSRKNSKKLLKPRVSEESAETYQLPPKVRELIKNLAEKKNKTKPLANKQINNAVEDMKPVKSILKNPSRDVTSDDEPAENRRPKVEDWRQLYSKNQVYAKTKFGEPLPPRSSPPPQKETSKKISGDLVKNKISEDLGPVKSILKDHRDVTSDEEPAENRKPKVEDWRQLYSKNQVFSKTKFGEPLPPRSSPPPPKEVKTKKSPIEVNSEVISNFKKQKELNTSSKFHERKRSESPRYRPETPEFLREFKKNQHVPKTRSRSKTKSPVSKKPEPKPVSSKFRVESRCIMCSTEKFQCL